jgi:hypothetical protein
MKNPIDRYLKPRMVGRGFWSSRDKETVGLCTMAVYAGCNPCDAILDAMDAARHDAFLRATPISLN